jgi:hypothetical protein
MQLPNCREEVPKGCSRDEDGEDCEEEEDEEEEKEVAPSTPRCC